MSDIKDPDITAPTPEACAVPCRAEAVLRATADVLILSRKLSGVLVLLVELVRSQRLYEAAGYVDMKTYFANVLGITKRNTRKRMCAAGRAGWRIYPELARQVIASLEVTGGTSAPDLPNVPAQSALALLPVALERSDDPSLARRVLEGEVTVAALTKLARPCPKLKKRSKSIKNTGSNGKSKLTSIRMPHALLAHLQATADDQGLRWQTLAKNILEQGLAKPIRRTGLAKTMAAPIARRRKPA